MVANYLHAVLFLNQNFLQVLCEGSQCPTESDVGVGALQQQMVNKKNSNPMNEALEEAEAAKPGKEVQKADIVADETTKLAIELPPNGRENLVLEERRENLVLEERESFNHTASHVLIVTVERANNLQTSWWSHSDPYVEFQIAHKDFSKRRTKTVHDNPHPIWNQKVHYKNYQPGDVLSFKVWDEDHGWDDSLGDAYLTPDCKQTGTKTLSLSTSGTLTVKIECVGSPKISHVEAMVRIASEVYNVHKEPYEQTLDLGDWDLVDHKREWGDNLAVYQNGKECTLAFTGSETLVAGSQVRDWFTNAFAVSTSKCGNRIHAGFYNEVLRATITTHWNSVMQPFLASDACSGGVYVVGHSLGGAAASVFTACVNQQEKWLWGKGFKVKEVYTIGAPAVSKEPLRQSDGCLKGLRIYNEDETTYDYVPYLAQWAGMVHPNLKAVKLTKKTNDEVEKQELDCNSKEAVNGDKKVDSVGVLKVSSNVNAHLAPEYISRTQKTFRIR